MRLLTFIMGRSVLEETLRGQFRVWEEEPVHHARFPSQPEVIWAAPRPTEVHDLIPFLRGWRQDAERSLSVVLMEAPGFSDPTEFLASLMASGYALELVMIREADACPVPRVERIFRDSITWIDSARPHELRARLRLLRGVSSLLQRKDVN